MNLVAYSDSEGSDNEVVPSPRPTAKPAAKLLKPSTHKVKVNLGSLPSNAGKDDLEKDAPPAKKPRTGGAGLNISAFLPAPKRTAQVSRGLGKGVNLKTAAEPAFTREPPPQSYGGDSKEGAVKETVSPKETESSTPAQPEVKLVGNARRFVPLSVARNAKKKKKTVLLPVASSTKAELSDPIPAATAPKPPPVKPKVSLFSMGTQEGTSTIRPRSPTADYAPIMLEEDTPVDDTEDLDEAYDQHRPYEPPASSKPSGQTINALTSDLNLSAADMRQLFGRKGGKDPDSTAINVVNFNTDAEYAANNDIIAKGETVTHNPVRTIAPGKHSLKQLVNAATANKEALEEHFANGQRNRKEAGARYGW